MKSLGSSTSESNDDIKPSASAAEVTPQPVRAVCQQAPRTNDQAPQVAAVQVVADSATSPVDGECESDTETDDSEEETSSESAASADDNDVAEQTVVTSQSPTVSSSSLVIYYSLLLSGCLFVSQ